jgi:hypothetical protein
VLEDFCKDREMVQGVNSGKVKPKGYDKASHLYSMATNLQGEAYELFKEKMKPIRYLKFLAANKDFSCKEYTNEEVTARPPKSTRSVIHVSCQNN